MILSRSVLRMRNISDTSCTENQNTHFMFSNSFESLALYGNVEKYSRAGRATDDSTAHEHCMLDNSITHSQNGVRGGAVG